MGLVFSSNSIQFFAFSGLCFVFELGKTWLGGFYGFEFLIDEEEDAREQSYSCEWASKEEGNIGWVSEFFSFLGYGLFKLIIAPVLGIGSDLLVGQERNWDIYFEFGFVVVLPALSKVLKVFWRFSHLSETFEFRVENGFLHWSYCLYIVYLLIDCSVCCWFLRNANQKRPVLLDCLFWSYLLLILFAYIIATNRAKKQGQK